MSIRKYVYVGVYFLAYISPADFYELCERMFDDVDKFNAVIENDYIFILGNALDASEYVYIEESTWYDIPKNEEAFEWKALAAELEAGGVKFEKRFGIVSYWR